MDLSYLVMGTNRAVLGTIVTVLLAGPWPLAAQEVGSVRAGADREPRAASVAQEVRWQTPKGWIGISYDDEQYEQWVEGGRAGQFTLLVLQVWEGSPAAAAGLRAGDRIVTIGGRPPTPETFADVVRTLMPGDRLALAVQRDGASLEVNIVAGTRPDHLAMPAPEVMVRIDSLRNEIIATIENLRFQELALREGEGVVHLRIGQDSAGARHQVIIAGPDSAGVMRIDRLPRGEGEEFTWEYAFNIPELGETYPFAALLAHSERVEELRSKLKGLQEAEWRAQQEEIRRTRELAEQRSREARTIDVDDPQLRAYRQAREAYQRQIEEMRRELERVSREELKSQRVRVVVPAPPEAEELVEFRPLAPYVLGERYVAGAELTPLNPQLAEYFSVDTGLLVTEVVAGSPASDAGLRPGDIIVAAGGQAVASEEDVRRALVSSRATELRLTIVRKGTRAEIILQR